MSDAPTKKKHRFLKLATGLVAIALGGLFARNFVHYVLAPSMWTTYVMHIPAEPKNAPVLLFHGNPGSFYDFSRTEDLLLKAGHPALRADRPGHGGNRNAAIGLSLPEQARALHETAQKIGIERPIVVGFSYGGSVALAYAEEFPQDVRALVIVASLGDPAVEHIINPVQKLVALPGLGPLIAWTIGPLAAQGEIEKGLAGAFAPDPVDADCLARAKELWSSPWALRASACDWPAFDASFAAVAARYGEIKVPVEVVAAAGDTIVPAVHGEFLRDHVPGARLTIVPGKNHMLPYTAPEAIADAVERAAARAR